MKSTLAISLYNCCFHEFFLTDNFCNFYTVQCALYFCENFVKTASKLAVFLPLNKLISRNFCEKIVLEQSRAKYDCQLSHRCCILFILLSLSQNVVLSLCQKELQMEEMLRNDKKKDLTCIHNVCYLRIHPKSTPVWDLLVFWPPRIHRKLIGHPDNLGKCCAQPQRKRLHWQRQPLLKLKTIKKPR